MTTSGVQLCPKTVVSRPELGFSAAASERTAGALKALLAAGFGRRDSMPRRSGHREGTCKTCLHPERTRIDYLIATGVSLKPLASRFGLKPSSLYNHSKKHVSPEY